MTDLYFYIFRTYHSYSILLDAFQVSFYIIWYILFHIIQFMWSGGWKEPEPWGVRKGRCGCWGFRWWWNHTMSVVCPFRHTGGNEPWWQRNERWICRVHLLSNLWGNMSWTWHFLVLRILVASCSGSTL